MRAGTFLGLLGMMAVLFALSPETNRTYLLLAAAGILLLAYLYLRFLPSSFDYALKLSSSVPKKKTITGSFHMTHHGYFPVFYGKAKGNVKNLMTGDECSFWLDIGLLGKEEGIVPFEISPKIMGIYEVAIKEVSLFGLFGCGKKRAFLNLKKECMVLPQITELSFPTSPRPVRCEDGEEIFYSGRGQEPSFYQGIRPYAEGDSLKRIHWKMTGKTGEYMVKEMGEPMSKILPLFLDTEMTVEDPQRADRLMEALYSVSLHLVEEGVSHFLCWKEENLWRQHRVDSLEDMEESFDRLLRCPFSVQNVPWEIAGYFPQKWRNTEGFLFLTSREEWIETELTSGAPGLVLLLEKEEPRKRKKAFDRCICFTDTTMKKELGRITLWKD